DRRRPSWLLLRRARRHDLRYRDDAPVGDRFRRRRAAPPGTALRSGGNGGIFCGVRRAVSPRRRGGAGPRGLSVCRGLRDATVRLGVSQALRHGGRTVQPVSPVVAGPGRLRCPLRLPGVEPAMSLSPALAPLTGIAAAAPRKSRPYVFLGQTTSLCETCL